MALSPELDRDTVERLARKVLGRLEDASVHKRIVIGIAGVPGSGKTTVAAAVSARVNQLYQLYQQGHPDAAPIAAGLPMDGFHLTRAQLAALPDPVEATHRRGAAFTFDAEGFLALIRSLSGTPRRAVRAPAFDHAVKDPVADAILVSEAMRVVFVEGNYCALDREPWKTAAGLMDELWYVDVPAAVAHERLAKRHLASGIVADQQEAWERATGTDEMNALDVREHRLPCSETIIST